MSAEVPATNTRQCLKVVVQSARFEGDQELQDPICRVTLGKQVHETPPGEGTKPRWKANFIFCYGKDQDLRFEVFDNDSPVGAVEVDLETLTTRPEQSFRGKIDLAPSGTLRVELKILPFKRGLDGNRSAEAAPPPLGKGVARSASREPAAGTAGRIMPAFPTADSGSKAGLLLLMPELEGGSAVASLWGDLANSTAPPPKPEKEFFVLKDDDIHHGGVGGGVGGAGSAAADDDGGASSIATTAGPTRSSSRTGGGGSRTRAVQRTTSTSSHRSSSQTDSKFPTRRNRRLKTTGATGGSAAPPLMQPRLPSSAAAYGMTGGGSSATMLLPNATTGAGGGLDLPADCRRNKRQTVHIPSGERAAMNFGQRAAHRSGVDLRAAKLY